VSCTDDEIASGVATVSASPDAASNPSSARH
jgi:hypothetical protein